MAIIVKEHRTPTLKKAEIEKKWYLVDAKDKTLGRLASEVATRLRGKHKPQFTPHMDCGDNIVIINAAQIVVTGKKSEQKNYYHHSSFPGGLRTTSYKEMNDKHPDRILLSAIKGMLPKNSLGRKMLTNVRVFAGEEHTMHAQKPEKIEI